MPTPRDMRRLVEFLAPFDVADLASGVGALQLLPENADRLLRLEALAGVIAHLPEKSARSKLGPLRWREVCNAPALTGFISQEDPFDHLFVDQITIFGGSHRVLTGLADEAVFVTRQLLRAIFLDESPFPDRTFVEMARGMAQLVLGLSDAVAHQASLPRGTHAIHGAADVDIPRAARFETLRSAVTLRARP